MMLRWLLVTVVACRSMTPDAPELGSWHAVPEPSVLEDRGRLRHAMREQRETLLGLEGAVAAGQLEEARALAFMIAGTDRGEASPASARVATTAREIAGSSTIEQIRFSIPRLVAACSGCHPFPRDVP